MSQWEILLATLGMTVITVITRAFFLLPDRELPLPAWLRQGLRYAPLAALLAVVVPQTVMSDGAVITTWRDARLFAVAAGVTYYVWRRGILGTIVCGTAVMMLLRITLGW